MSPEVTTTSWWKKFALFFLWAYRRKLHHPDHWKFSEGILPLSRRVLTNSAVLGCTMVFESNVSRSFDSSGKGLPGSFISSNNFWILSEKDFWGWLLYSWCVISSFATLGRDANSYCDMSTLTSAPDTIYQLSAERSSVSPMALPSPFMTALAGSCAWLIVKAENSPLDLCTTKFPCWNSLKTSGWVCSKVTIYLRWMGSQLAQFTLLFAKKEIRAASALQYKPKLTSLKDQTNENVTYSIDNTRSQNLNWGLSFQHFSHQSSKSRTASFFST